MASNKQSIQVKILELEELHKELVAAGQSVHMIDGAHIEKELDAKKAIKEAMELVIKL